MHCQDQPQYNTAKSISCSISIHLYKNCTRQLYLTAIETSPVASSARYSCVRLPSVVKWWKRNERYSTPDGTLQFGLQRCKATYHTITTVILRWPEAARIFPRFLARCFHCGLLHQNCLPAGCWCVVEVVWDSRDILATAAVQRILQHQLRGRNKQHCVPRDQLLLSLHHTEQHQQWRQ